MTTDTPGQQPPQLEDLIEALSVRMAVNRAATARRQRLKRMERDIIRHHEQQGKL